MKVETECSVDCLSFLINADANSISAWKTRLQQIQYFIQPWVYNFSAIKLQGVCKEFRKKKAVNISGALYDLAVSSKWGLARQTQHKSQDRYISHVYCCCSGPELEDVEDFLSGFLRRLWGCCPLQVMWCIRWRQSLIMV